MYFFVLGYFGNTYQAAKEKKSFALFFQHFDFVSIFLKQECATPNGTYNLRFELDFRREFSRPSVDLTICVTKGKLQKYLDLDSVVLFLALLEDKEASV